MATPEASVPRRWVVAGLGNPGPGYKNTRHNVGFMVADALARRWSVSFDREKFESLYAQAQCGSAKVALLKPQTFMNRSGQALAEAARNQCDGPEAVLVLVDDSELPFGRLRLRARGSAGGHNGLRSIIELLGSQEFPRLRIGIGRSDAGEGLKQHVLGAFSPEERSALPGIIDAAAEAVQQCVTMGVEKTMNRVNAAPPAQEETGGADSPQGDGR